MNLDIFQLVVSKKKGSVIVGVLAAIVFVGIVTSFLVSLTQSGSRSTSAFLDVQNASHTSRHALYATEQFIRHESEQTLTIIEEVIENGPQPFISENLGNNQPFNVILNSFDVSTNVAEFESIAMNGVKRSIGKYHLEHIEITHIIEMFNSAVYANGDIDLYDTETVIIGNTFFNDIGHLTGNSPYRHVFDGDFVWKGSTGQIHGEIRVTGNAYFDIDIEWNPGVLTNDLLFEQNVVFNGNILSNGTFDIHGNGIFNGNVSAGQAFINANNNPLYFGGSISYDTSSPTDSSVTIYNHSTINHQYIHDVQPYLPGTNINPPPEPSIDISVIPDSLIHNWSDHASWWPVGPLRGGWSGGNLQEVYDEQQQSGKLWNDFLVLNVNQTHDMTGNQTGHDNLPNEFDGKVIFIIDNHQMQFQKNMYHHTENARTLIYAKGGNNSRRVDNFGTQGNNVFRGMIHVESGEIRCDPFTMEGALHAVGDNSEIQFDRQGSTQKHIIEFKSEVLDDLAKLPGLFVTDGESSDNELILVEDIIPHRIFIYHY